MLHFYHFFKSEAYTKRRCLTGSLLLLSEKTDPAVWNVFRLSSAQLACGARLRSTAGASDFRLDPKLPSSLSQVPTTQSCTTFFKKRVSPLQNLQQVREGERNRRAPSPTRETATFSHSFSSFGSSATMGGKMLPQPALEAWKAGDLGAVDMQELKRSCARCNRSLRRVENADTLPCGHELCSTCLQTADETDEMALSEGSACKKIAGVEWKSRESRSRSAKIELLIRNLRREQRPRANGTRKR